jgi:hypothetical protein
MSTECTELLRLLLRADVSGWPRLFHSLRANRQTELQREFRLHVVCSWLGNRFSKLRKSLDARDTMPLGCINNRSCICEVPGLR